MLTDIAEARGTQKGVRHSVADHIGVGMTQETPGAWEAYSS
jgi:hypothetical protein